MLGVFLFELRIIIIGSGTFADDYEFGMNVSFFFFLHICPFHLCQLINPLTNQSGEQLHGQTGTSHFFSSKIFEQTG